MHWTEQLHQFKCNTGYWPLVHGVELSDGARYVTNAASARWLMLVIARELLDMGIEYWHLRMLVTRLLNSTHIKFIDAAGNNVCCCRVQAQMLDVRKFELRAGWTGNNWLIMLPAEDIR